MKPSYLLERWPHGWVIAAPEGQHGIPLDALNECLPLLNRTGREAIHNGIAHYLRETGHSRRAVMAIVSPAQADKWEREIRRALEDIADPHERWWKGLHVGVSSAAIFAALAPAGTWRSRALGFLDNRFSTTPADADDFGRCTRVVRELGWKERLPEVAAAYPQSHWPAVILRWSELQQADAAGCTALLREIHQAPVPARHDCCGAPGPGHAADCNYATGN